MTYRVVFSSRSNRELEAVRKYIESESCNPTQAHNYIARIYSACLRLAVLPKRYGYPYYNAKSRMMPFEQYLIFFDVFGNDVVILHIRHGARRLWKG